MAPDRRELHDVPTEWVGLGWVLVHGACSDHECVCSRAPGSIGAASDPRLYWSAGHILIAAAMLSILELGGLVTIDSLERALRERGDWRRCGGASYIGGLISACVGVHEIWPAIAWLHALRTSRRVMRDWCRLDDVPCGPGFLETERGRVDIAGRVGFANLQNLDERRAA